MIPSIKKIQNNLQDLHVKHFNLITKLILFFFSHHNVESGATSVGFISHQGTCYSNPKGLLYKNVSFFFFMFHLDSLTPCVVGRFVWPWEIT